MGADLLGMMGGLSLFLYGMNMMSEGLEEAAGTKLPIVLKKLTNHKIKAILVGMIVTCLIQSSSAMTVMLIGFVNAHIMSLQRAVWVVMGANIGTTITGQMIALDIGALAPVLSIIGVCFIVFSSKQFFMRCGEILGGFGILFMGLEMMSISMKTLNDSALFLSFIKTLSHPLLSVLVGIVFTAIIQSSSASIGILQALVVQKAIPFSQAVYFIFGFDIGTCMTAFLASLSGSLNAKRLALFHLLLNIIGTSLFMLLCHCTPLISFVEGLTPLSLAHQVANMHTLFNVVTTLFVITFDRYLMNLIYCLLPQRE